MINIDCIAVLSCPDCDAAMTAFEDDYYHCPACDQWHRLLLTACDNPFNNEDDDADELLSVGNGKLATNDDNWRCPEHGEPANCTDSCIHYLVHLGEIPF